MRVLSFVALLALSFAALALAAPQEQADASSSSIPVPPSSSSWAPEPSSTPVPVPSSSPAPEPVVSSSSSWAPEPSSSPAPQPSSSPAPEPSSSPAPQPSSSAAPEPSSSPAPVPSSSPAPVPSSSAAPEPSSSAAPEPSSSPAPEPSSSPAPAPSSSVPPAPAPSSSSAPMPSPTPIPSTGEYFVSIFSTVVGETPEKNTVCRFESMTDSVSLERVADSQGKCVQNKNGLYSLVSVHKTTVKSLKARCSDKECKTCDIVTEDLRLGSCGLAKVGGKEASLFVQPAASTCVGGIKTTKPVNPDDFVLVNYNDDHECSLDYTTGVSVADIGAGDGVCKLSLAAGQVYNRVSVDAKGVISASVGCRSNTCNDGACTHVNDWRAGECYGSYTLAQFKFGVGCTVKPVSKASKSTGGQIAGAIIGTMLALGLAVVLYRKYVRNPRAGYSQILADSDA